MIVLDALHPPATSTSWSFAFREYDENALGLFALALGIAAMLIILQRYAVWLPARLESRRSGDTTPE